MIFFQISLFLTKQTTIIKSAAHKKTFYTCTGREEGKGDNNPSNRQDYCGHMATG